MNESERNILTGTFQKSHDDNQELNSMTGTYFNKEKEDDSVSKSDEAKWPSISKRKDPEPQPEPVKKGSGSWPSLTGSLDKRAVEEPEQVSKSTDENPFPSLLKHLVGNVSESNQVEKLEKSFKVEIPIVAFEKKGDERVAYGVVYEPDTVDAQGDSANAEEIKKAAEDFLENVQVFKIQHKGKPVDIKVLQSFVAPADYTIAKRDVKKGSWVLVTRINDKQLWKDIKAGKITGYSMAGYARVEN